MSDTIAMAQLLLVWAVADFVVVIIWDSLAQCGAVADFIRDHSELIVLQIGRVLTWSCTYEGVLA